MDYSSGFSNNGNSDDATMSVRRYNILKFTRYTDIEQFKNDVLDILLEDEVQNNLPVSIVLNSSQYNSDNWLLSTVTDNEGVIVLVAICTLPFNILLYEPLRGDKGDKRGRYDIVTRLCDNIVPSPFVTLASNLKRIGFSPPGVLAESGLAR